MLLATLAACGFASRASADQIVFGGLITQSTQDGTGPAVNNPALNHILDGDVYDVTLGFAGSITSPGTYTLTGATLLFSDLSAPATEGSFSSASLSVVTDGGFYDLSLLGCLSTGSGCLLGNELAANFQIPMAGLNSTNVAAHAIPGLSPSLDLLEDDGVTDIQGSVTKYSYSGATATPEPSAIVPLVIFALLGWMRLRSQQMRIMKQTLFTILAAVLIPASAFAVDGVTLINQSTVMAAGGFPYVISQPGSYRLSGNLVAPAVSDAIQIATPNVTLDLNGFSISDSGRGSGAPLFLIRTIGAITGFTIRNGTLSSTDTAGIDAFSASGTVAQDLTLISVSGGGQAFFGNSAILRTVIYPTGEIAIDCQTLVADSVAGSFFRQTPPSASCLYNFGFIVGPVN